MSKHITSANFIIDTKGFTLVEIVLGIGLLTMFFIANSVYYQQVLKVSDQTTKHIQSGFLLEEGVEAVRLLRDQSWSGRIAPLTNGTTYYLYWNGTAWTATTTVQRVENIFTRSFIVAAVNRNLNDTITTSGGVLDTGTKKVAVSVSWAQKGRTVTSTTSIETYITNLFNN